MVLCIVGALSVPSLVSAFTTPRSWVHNGLKIYFVAELCSMSHCCSIMFVMK